MRKKKSLKTEVEQTSKLLIITLGIMIIILIIAFFYLTSQSAQLGYALEQEKIINQNLRSENSALKAKLTTAGSFSELKEKQEVKKMNSIEEKNFVLSEDNKVR